MQKDIATILQNADLLETVGADLVRDGKKMILRAEGLRNKLPGFYQGASPKRVRGMSEKHKKVVDAFRNSIKRKAQ